MAVDALTVPTASVRTSFAFVGASIGRASYPPPRSATCRPRRPGYNRCHARGREIPEGPHLEAPQEADPLGHDRGHPSDGRPDRRGEPGQRRTDVKGRVADPGNARPGP